MQDHLSSMGRSLKLRSFRCNLGALQADSLEDNRGQRLRRRDGYYVPYRRYRDELLGIADSTVVLIVDPTLSQMKQDGSNLV